MVQTPETRYVDVGGADVAYQLVGHGDVDLVYFWGLGSHVDLFWDHPAYADFLGRLSSFARVILFDRRGTGASDRVDISAIPTWEDCVEDLRAVLDAADSTSAVIYADVDAGPIAVLFAATYPDRVRGLILANSSARFLAATDYDIGMSEDDAAGIVELLRSDWGTERLYEFTSPGASADAEYVQLAAKMNRAALTPRTAAAMYSYALRSLDVRQALPLVRVPTLVLHNRQNPFVPLSHGQYLADRITHARFVPMDAFGITWTPESRVHAADLIEEFVTGQPAAADGDRVLTTLLLSDIVNSTVHVSQLGDEEWRRRLDSHDRAVRTALARFRGREVKSTGDGILAMFDGPARAIRCARDIVAATARLGVDVRLGIHSGECVLRGDDVAGLMVHVTARIANEAGPRQVLVSDVVKTLVAGSGIEFEDAGVRTLKGVEGPWPLFAAMPV